MAREEKEKTEKRGGQRSAVVLLAVLLVFVIAAAAVAVAYLLNHRTVVADKPTYETEVKARLGQLEGKTAEEIQAELDRVIDEGMFHVVINTDPVFANGTAEGSLEIENVPNNHYLMRVEIEREDTGELIYSTKYIETNTHIQRAALDVPLAAGDYFCVAKFYAYDPESLAEMGTVFSLITVHVLN